MRRSKSSKTWLAEHFSDEYVKRARREGYRSRAVYKLQEIDARDRLLKPGMTVVDLGAAPGGWAQYAAERVGPTGRVVALDILPMDALAGVEVITGDFTEAAVLAELETRLGGRPVDLVISDMAPNISGIGVSDQARAMYLAELAADFAIRHLKPGGGLLIKTFQGQGFTELLGRLRAAFGKVQARKPKASRDRSRETYLLARERRPDASG
ncbi:MAG TPA: 23S rRNA (uridine(2552)-2'-O)-methyltransferase RlmE [Acidiferrobacterales bacterium]|jgi:23S rRNA (uridine2552-2'-O)-methyltransferase